MPLDISKSWSEWAGAVLGAWLIGSPWILGFGDELAATQNAFIMGVLLIAAETAIFSAFRIWEEWAKVAIGVWLVISPWVLGIAAMPSIVSSVVVGMAVLALTAYAMWDAESSAHPA